MKIKVNRHIVREFEYLLGICVIASLLVFIGLNYSQTKLGNWIYKEYSEPFLVNQGTVAQHNNTTTKKLHIEYQVLKVPTSKTTAAKK